MIEGNRWIVAVVALAFPPGTVTTPPGSGFMVARDEDAAITACTWVTAKWPHVAGGPAILKCSLGRAGDDAVVERSDEELVALARRDLERMMGLTATPTETRVVRHRDALPQYAVGHAELVRRTEAAVARVMPGVALAGNAYRGVGLPACITSGRAAAERLLARGRTEPGAPTTPGPLPATQRPASASSSPASA